MVYINNMTLQRDARTRQLQFLMLCCLEIPTPLERERCMSKEKQVVFPDLNQIALIFPTMIRLVFCYNLIRQKFGMPLDASQVLQEGIKLCTNVHKMI